MQFPRAGGREQAADLVQRERPAAARVLRHHSGPTDPPPDRVLVEPPLVHQPIEEDVPRGQVLVPRLGPAPEIVQPRLKDRLLHVFERPHDAVLDRTHQVDALLADVLDTPPVVLRQMLQVRFDQIRQAFSPHLLSATERFDTDHRHPRCGLQRETLIGLPGGDVPTIDPCVVVLAAGTLGDLWRRHQTYPRCWQKRKYASTSRIGKSTRRPM